MGQGQGATEPPATAEGAAEERAAAARPPEWLQHVLLKLLLRLLLFSCKRGWWQVQHGDVDKQGWQKGQDDVVVTGPARHAGAWGMRHGRR
jgi:hypothetical protein